MTEQNKEPRWSVTYTVHLDDKNGKTWGTLRYNSTLYTSAAEIATDFSALMEHCYNVVKQGQRAFLKFPADEDTHPDSDHGFFADVKAFQFSVVDLWESESMEGFTVDKV